MSTNNSQGYNLDNFEASFREFLITERVSPATLKNYLSDLRHFMGWLFLHQSSKSSSVVSERSDRPIDTISTLDIATITAYKDYLVSNALPDKTVNRRLSTVRRFCSFCISQGWLKENPARSISNVGIGVRHHGHAAYQIEVQEDRHDSPDSNVVFSAKQLFEFQKSLSNLPVAEAQTIQKDIEEFFIIINSTKLV